MCNPSIIQPCVRCGCANDDLLPTYNYDPPIEVCWMCLLADMGASLPIPNHSSGKITPFLMYALLVGYSIEPPMGANYRKTICPGTAWVNLKLMTNVVGWPQDRLVLFLMLLLEEGYLERLHIDSTGITYTVTNHQRLAIPVI